MEWNSKLPIYQQLQSLIAAAILDEHLNEGDAIPSIRQISADYAVNPLTVSKAVQGLVDDGIVEKRRGLGMYVKPGARAQLLQIERERFMRDEWPEIQARIKRLGIDVSELMK